MLKLYGVTFESQTLKVQIIGERKEHFDSVACFFFQVKQCIMNPKAMPRQQLLGQIDMDTREWTDGVLTNSARNVVREPQGQTSKYSLI